MWSWLCWLGIKQKYIYTCKNVPNWKVRIFYNPTTHLTLGSRPKLHAEVAKLLVVYELCLKINKSKKKNVASYLMKHEYTITILASQMVLFLMLHRIYESYKAWKHKWKLDLSELSRESQVSSATTLASTNQQHNKCHVLMLQPASLSLTAE